MKGISLVLIAITIIAIFPSVVFAQEEVEDKIIDDMITFEIPELPEEITGQDLNLLYQPSVETLSELGRILADGLVKFFAFMITIVIGVVIGKGVGRILSKIIKKIFRNEKLLTAMGMKQKDYEESSWYKIHELIPFTIRWFIYITAFVIGFGFLNIPEASNLMAEFSAWVPRIIIFLVSIVIGFVIVKIALKWITDVKPALFGDEVTSKIIKGIISAIIYAVVFGIGLTTLGIGEQIIPIFYWVIPAGVMGILIAIAVGARKTGMYLVLGESIKRQGIIGATIRFTHFEHKIQGTITDIGLAHFKFTEIKVEGKEKPLQMIYPINILNEKAFEILEPAPDKNKDKKKD